METKRSRMYVHDMIISIVASNLNLEIDETKNVFGHLINQLPLEELLKLPKPLIQAKSVAETAEMLNQKLVEHR